MDRPTTMLYWGMGFALSFSVWGLFFGGLARFFAQRWRRSPENTASQAFFAGAVRGAVFLAILGVLLGGLAGYLQEPDSAGVAVTIAFLLLLGLVAVLALFFGVIGYLIEWLGVSKEFWELPDQRRTMNRP